GLAAEAAGLRVADRGDRWITVVLRHPPRNVFGGAVVVVALAALVDGVDRDEQPRAKRVERFENRPRLRLALRRVSKARRRFEIRRREIAIQIDAMRVDALAGGEPVGIGE